MEISEVNGSLLELLYCFRYMLGNVRNINRVVYVIRARVIFNFNRAIEIGYFIFFVFKCYEFIYIFYENILRFGF